MSMKYYHYTPEVKIDEIIQSGKIKLSTESVFSKKEKPCAWVSTNQKWENTATKMISDANGKQKQLTFDEQLELFGCARIEVNPSGLATWSKIKYLAKMDLKFAEIMVEVGIEKGGVPSEWFGSLFPIGKERWIKAEVYRNGEWVEYKVF